MFALSIQALIEAIDAKKVEDLSIRALLYYAVPDAQFGYPLESTGDFETESEYDALVWLDERTKPTWAELSARRQELFEFELALDLDQLRERRYRETEMPHGGASYTVNPTTTYLLDSQIKLAESTGSESIMFLAANRKCVSLSLADANQLLTAMRTLLNQWIVDPRITD